MHSCAYAYIRVHLCICVNTLRDLQVHSTCEINDISWQNATDSKIMRAIFFSKMQSKAPSHGSSLSFVKFLYFYSF